MLVFITESAKFMLFRRSFEKFDLVSLMTDKLFPGAPFSSLLAIHGAIPQLPHLRVPIPSTALAT
jgi:hypothetical protein